MKQSMNFVRISTSFDKKLADASSAPVIMTHNESDPEVIRAIEADTSLACTVCKMRVVELVWLFDNFCFRTYEFIYSPFKVKEHIGAFVKSVSGDREWLTCYRALNPDDGTCLKFKHTFFYTKLWILLKLCSRALGMA